VGVEEVRIRDLAEHGDWSAALDGVASVIHVAGRAHVMHETADDPLAEFRRVNVAGTSALARQAARAGARRFVFISSIKVNGEETMPGRPYRADDVPAPSDAYGVSKHEAEEELRLIAHETGMEVVVIRPVLVYGPGVKGNFRSMMRWLRRRIPLPLGAIHNRRSLVSIDNLVDLIVTALRHRAAANRTFLVSDGEDLSTTDLLRRLGAAFGETPPLLPVPSILLETPARLLGRGRLVNRLCGSLQVDITETRSTLDWTPPVQVDEALRRTAVAFLEGERG
jgi:nucleoside-diphosphate-sugar epimerase